MDPITETIAHFIGVFEIEIEKARAREQYDEFSAKLAAETDENALPQIDYRQSAPHLFNETNPAIRYNDPGTIIPPGGNPPDMSYYLRELDVPPGGRFQLNPDKLFIPPAFSQAGNATAIIYDPPASIAFLLKQLNNIEDNDFLNMLSEGFDFQFQEIPSTYLEALLNKIASIDPLKIMEMPENELAIADRVQQIAKSISHFEAQDTNGLTIQAHQTDGSSGIYVNGVSQAEAPNLSDFITPSNPAETTKAADQDTPFEPGNSVTISTGDNFLVNDVMIASSWSVSPVMAVVGNHTTVNVISQINVYQNTDTLAEGFDSWSPRESAATVAMNIAAFTGEAAPGQQEIDPDAKLSFPKAWSTTTIEGNLVFLNWVEQVNFVTDNDVSLLTASGSETIVTLGDNYAFNALSLVEIANFYDLIIIGGDFYNANVISQTNLLVDSDYLSIMSGFGTHGKEDYATDDNLLWNQANIHTIGQTQFEGLPDHYLAAANNLQAGSDKLTSDILAEEAFAGLSSLRVLYVEGSILNLQYIKQTNVLGDADQVALAAANFQADPNADWDISTGSNALLNLATIVDAGADSTVYVGGEQYSDALLYQAELISHDDPFASSGSGELASEAVVFLSDDLTSPENGNSENEAVQPVTVEENVSVDVMQTMLS